MNFNLVVFLLALVSAVSGGLGALIGLLIKLALSQTDYTVTLYISLVFLAVGLYEAISTPFEVWLEYLYLKSTLNSFMLDGVDDDELPFWIKKPTDLS